MKSSKINLAVLFSGGKDSCYATFIAKKYGYKISCLITIDSENKESYMFHTPSISKVKHQAKAMRLPIIIKKTKGKKETELKDLESAIKSAIERYNVQGVVTGALESIYQASRVQKICTKLNIDCFNPLWQKDQNELLEELIKNKFDVIITGVFAYPLDKTWLGRKIDKKFIKDLKSLQEKYKINPAGEGGEFETFVRDCSLFKSKLKIKSFKDSGEKNSWVREVEVI